MEIIVTDNEKVVGLDDSLDASHDIEFVSEILKRFSHSATVVEGKGFERLKDDALKAKVQEASIGLSSVHGKDLLFYDSKKARPILYEVIGYNCTILSNEKTPYHLEELKKMMEVFKGEDEFEPGGYEFFFSKASAMFCTYYDGGALFLNVGRGEVDSYVDAIRAVSAALGGKDFTAEIVGPKRKPSKA